MITIVININKTASINIDYRISRDEILRKMGELFALRHIMNLRSDLLDIPDFYWESEQLEELYTKTSSYFSISKRTKVFIFENLNLCWCLKYIVHMS